MRDLALQTGGAFLQLPQLMEQGGSGRHEISSGCHFLLCTALQRVLLVRTFHPYCNQPSGVQRKLKEYVISCHLFRVLDLRLQEGFRIVSVDPSKDGGKQGNVSFPLYSAAMYSISNSTRDNMVRLSMATGR